MKILIFGLMVVIAISISGCGGTKSAAKSYYEADTSASSSYYEESSKQRATGSTSQTHYKKGAVQYQKSEGQQQQKTINQQNIQQQEANKSQKQIYTASVSMEVRELKQTQDEILKIMDSVKGFLESQTIERIVIRVPSQAFDATLISIYKLGVILNKKIATYDVSEKYSDLSRRLEIAEKARERLLDMLSKTKKIEEKIRIIKELERITKEIETYKSILNTLDSFINYSVIEILLKTPQDKDVQANFTPFGWINRLNPNYPTLEKVTDKEITIELPADFILFDKEDTYTARNPRGSLLRIGKTKNNPVGDAQFWVKSLNNGLFYRNFEKISTGKTGVLEYALYEYKTLKPFCYFVALTVHLDQIIVIEVFFPDIEDKNKYIEPLVKKLSLFKVN